MSNQVDIVFTGGGTAGHVTPNLALFADLQKQGHRLAYIGQANSIEEKLVTEAQVSFHPITAGKLRRYFDWQNLTDVFRIALALLQSFWLMRKLRPKLLFSKGGFVSTPVVWAAFLWRVPIIVHESDITPGLANRLSMPFAKKVCYSFPETAKHLPEEKALFTGLPIRDELQHGDANTAIRLCGFESRSTLPSILIMGGSQGSLSINGIIRQLLPTLLEKYNLCHICGDGAVNHQYEGIAGYKQFGYVSQELPDLLALSDIVVSRAGATSIFEFLSLQKPAVLIPLSLSASRGDQILNAASFQKQGFALTLDEKQLLENPALLTEQIHVCFRQADAMKKAMSEAAQQHGKEQILSLINNYF